MRGCAGLTLTIVVRRVPHALHLARRTPSLRGRVRQLWNIRRWGETCNDCGRAYADRAAAIQDQKNSVNPSALYVIEALRAELSAEASAALDKFKPRYGEWVTTSSGVHSRAVDSVMIEHRTQIREPLG